MLRSGWRCNRAAGQRAAQWRGRCAVGLEAAGQHQLCHRRAQQLPRPRQRGAWRCCAAAAEPSQHAPGRQCAAAAIYCQNVKKVNNEENDGATPSSRSRPVGAAAPPHTPSSRHQAGHSRGGGAGSVQQLGTHPGRLGAATPDTTRHGLRWGN